MGGTHMICRHTIEQGLILGKDVTETVSEEISTMMSAVFMNVFSIGLSHSTMYSWSERKSADYGKVVTMTVTCTVPEGDTVRIKQVWGRCGDTTVKVADYT